MEIESSHWERDLVDSKRRVIYGRSF
jgi:hypothetical protein